MLTDGLERRLKGIEDASRKGRRVKDLYRMLYDEDLWMLAYANVHANKGAATRGVNGDTLDGMSEARVRSIIGGLKEGTYRPRPVRRTYIPKANGKKRPLGIPTGTDKLVQEAVRILLERIYEPVFSDRSHGFRPGRSCHTALNQLVNTWSGIKWVVDVDVEGFFDHVDHDVLARLLKRRIDDKRFVGLIGWMLRAGYVEDWKYHATYSGTPQGGTVSPILANVILHELDDYMAEEARAFNAGGKRRYDKTYLQWRHRVYKARKRAAKLQEAGASPKETSAARAEEARYMEEMKEHPCYDQHDPGFRRMQYVRYADDFAIGVIGTKQDAQALMERVSSFLERELGLKVSQEKSGVVHFKDGFRFLGYLVSTNKAGKRVRRRIRARTVTMRTTGHQPRLYVPHDALRSFCKKNGYGDYEAMRTTHRRYLLGGDDVEIIATYNAELRGLANYYALAPGCKNALNRLEYMAHYSLFKTLAFKHRTSMISVIKMLKGGGSKEYVYRYEVGEAKKEIRVYKLKHLRKPDPRRSEVAEIPNTLMYSNRTELLERLKANECELCGKETPCEVHHVRKLADLKGKDLPMWKEVMLARRRKTLVVCHACHQGIHHGRLPDLRYASGNQ